MPKPVVHSMMEMLVAPCPQHDKKTRHKQSFTETLELSTDRAKLMLIFSEDNKFENISRGGCVIL